MLDALRSDERIVQARAWAKDASHRVDQVGVRLYAAAIAYRTIFSLLAFLSTILLVLSLSGIDASELRVQSDRVEVRSELEGIAYDRAARSLELGQSSVVVAGLVGLVLGLYGMAGGFAALCDVLDRIHGSHRYRRLTFRYLRGGFVALVFTTLAFVAIAAFALTTSFGEFVLDAIGLSVLEGAMYFMVGTIIPLVAILVAFAFVLRYGSHARPPMSQVLVGAAVAGVGWMLLLFGFLAFVSLMQPFHTYGAMASSVSLLLFGYLQSYLLVLVAMFGAELVWIATFGRTHLLERRRRGANSESTARESREQHDE